MSRDFSGDEGTNKRGTTTTTTTTTSGRFEGTVLENIYVRPNTQFNNKVPSKKEKQKDNDN